MDTIYASLLFVYVGFAIIKLIYLSWKYSRLEARAHMFYFVTNSLGLLTALPLVVNNLLVFSRNPTTYVDMRFSYYEDFVAKCLPSFLYIATKKNEDCFNCFNRLAPQKFSIFQFSKTEIKIYSRDSIQQKDKVSSLGAIFRSCDDNIRIQQRALLNQTDTIR